MMIESLVPEACACPMSQTGALNGKARCSHNGLVNSKLERKGVFYGPLSDTRLRDYYRAQAAD